MCMARSVSRQTSSTRCDTTASSNCKRSEKLSAIEGRSTGGAQPRRTDSRRRGGGSIMPVLRTLLFAPANHSRHVEKALAGAADGAILDLEDAVAVAEKPEARHAA